MTKEKMSIYKALSELKVLNKRVCDAIGDGTFCATNKHTNQKISGIPVEKYGDEVIKASFDKVDSLIRRYRAIRRAITRSNAVTTIEIDGETYTVAEAIEQHQRGVEPLEEWVRVMKIQRDKAVRKLAYNESSELDEAADNYVGMMFGSKDNKVSNDQIEGLKKQYKAAQQIDFIDPLKIDQKIDELEAKIAKMKSDFDSALSVSNATTIIEIEY